MRQALARDLNAPAALEAVDSWAKQAQQSAAAGSRQDQALVRDALDALLGVGL
ncbi:cysteinyl-tRNA synthetase [Arthrobacter pascens]|nr:cysteinyl-tRNA synthetase [Arthrobacter pascens]